MIESNVVNSADGIHSNVVSSGGASVEIIDVSESGTYPGIYEKVKNGKAFIKTSDCLFTSYVEDSIGLTLSVTEFNSGITPTVYSIRVYDNDSVSYVSSETFNITPGYDDLLPDGSHTTVGTYELSNDSDEYEFISIKTYKSGQGYNVQLIPNFHSQSTHQVVFLSGTVGIQIYGTTFKIISNTSSVDIRSIRGYYYKI